MPPKKPKHFSPIRPFKYLIWLWFWALSGMIKWGWYEVDKSGGDLALPMINAILLYGGMLPAIVAMSLGLFGKWIALAIVVWVLINLGVYFMFHLNEEEGRTYWRNKLKN